MMDPGIISAIAIVRKREQELREKAATNPAPKPLHNV
jgi:hypothetical protein